VSESITYYGMEAVTKFLAALSPEDKTALISAIQELSGCYDEAGRLLESDDLITVREVEELFIPFINAGRLPDSKEYRETMAELGYSEEDIANTLEWYLKQALDIEVLPESP
jgi:hypothetical protein